MWNHVDPIKNTDSPWTNMEAPRLACVRVIRCSCVRSKVRTGRGRGLRAVRADASWFALLASRVHSFHLWSGNNYPIASIWLHCSECSSWSPPSKGWVRLAPGLAPTSNVHQLLNWVTVIVQQDQIPRAWWWLVSLNFSKKFGRGLWWPMNQWGPID